MLEYIRNELLGMTDKGEYAAFTSSLIPGCDNIIGIRQPVLKQYAKQLIKENKDFRQLLSEPDIYQEETLLRSYIIGMGTAKEKDFKKALKDFNAFVPLVNNWAVNDSFCVEFRVMDMFRDEFLPYIKECIESCLEPNHISRSIINAATGSDFISCSGISTNCANVLNRPEPMPTATPMIIPANSPLPMFNRLCESVI